MNEDNWAELVEHVCNGNVIPVVGPELLAMPDEAGGRVSLEAMMSEELALALRMAPETLPRPLRIRDVANAFLAMKQDADDTYAAKRGRLKLKLHQIMKKLTQCPPAIQQLADITSFKLFVSVTPDALLQRTLNQVRFGGRPDSIVRANDLTEKPENIDLPAPLSTLRNMNKTAIFYPFGHVDGDFAITEEDTLEFLLALRDKKDQLRNLFEVLGRSNLLFLGCNFPDWLTRFWIRTLMGRRLQDSREQLELVADRCVKEDNNLVMFLKRTIIRVYHEGDAETFVKELHARWSAKRVDEPAPPVVKGAPVKQPQVFISYSMTTDKAEAERVNALLREKGLETWFDEVAAESGEEVSDELAQAIKRSTLFVPIISRAAADRLSGHYRAEWGVALGVAQRRTGSKIPFIHPILVDDIPLEYAGIPEAFWMCICEPAPGGAISDRFAERLKMLVRKAQVQG